MKILIDFTYTSAIKIDRCLILNFLTDISDDFTLILVHFMQHISYVSYLYPDSNK